MRRDWWLLAQPPMRTCWWCTTRLDWARASKRFCKRSCGAKYRRYGRPEPSLARQLVKVATPQGPQYLLGVTPP